MSEVITKVILKQDNDENIPYYIANSTYGYFNKLDGKFYQDPYFISEIAGINRVIYVDLLTNNMYRYDEENSVFLSIGGGFNNVKYVDVLPTIEIKDTIYATVTKKGIYSKIANTEFLDNNPLFIKESYNVTSYKYIAAEGVELEGSIDGTSFKTFASINKEEGNIWTIHYFDNTNENIVNNDNFYYREVSRKYYAGDSINQALTPLLTKEDIVNKQNKLIFDSAPTAGSTNPVTSEGIYNKNVDIDKEIGTYLNANGTKNLINVNIESQTMNDVTFNFRKTDSTINVSGTPSNSAYITLIPAKELYPGKYKLSGLTGTSNLKYHLVIKKLQMVLIDEYITEDYVFEIDPSISVGSLFLTLCSNEVGVPCSGRVYPMLSIANNNISYEKYIKTNRELEQDIKELNDNLGVHFVEITLEQYIDNKEYYDSLDDIIVITDDSFLIEVASQIEYNNTTSGLAATNVQAAIDELNSKIGGGGSSDNKLKVVSNVSMEANSEGIAVIPEVTGYIPIVVIGKSTVWAQGIFTDNNTDYYTIVMDLYGMAIYEGSFTTTVIYVKNT